MSDRKTLQLRDPSDTGAPALKKQGRGWKISGSRLDTLHDRARDLRREPTPAHAALAARFATADLGRYSFTRQAVIGSAIVDFGCPNLGLAIAIDEGDDALAARRDKSLEAVGIRVLRVTAADIAADIDAVLRRISQAIDAAIAAKQVARRAHNATSPRRPASGGRTYGNRNAQNR